MPEKNPIKDLFLLLEKNTGVRLTATRKRSTFYWPPGTSDKDKKSIQDLVFGNLDVIKYLADHPAVKITHANFLY